MKNRITYILITLFIASCGKEEIVADNIFVALTPSQNEVTADGSSTITIKAFLHPDGDESLRTINFKVDKGVFVESGTNELTKAAEINPADSVEAEVVLRAPSSPGTITVSAQVVLKDLKDRYIKTTTIQANESVVSTLDLTSSSISVVNNFGSEVTITGSLKNSAGANASSGVTVIMYDTDASNNLLSGNFRNQVYTSGGDSKVSVLYSPGSIASDQFVYVKAEVIDENMNPVGIKDSVRLYVRTN